MKWREKFGYNCSNKIFNPKPVEEKPKYCLIMYFEGYPKEIHKLTVSTWNRNKFIDFYIITTKEYLKAWTKFSKNFERIIVLRSLPMVNFLFSCNIISSHSYNIIKNIEPRRLIPGLRPFMSVMFGHIYKDYDNYGWIDHDVILSSNFNPEKYINNKKVSYKFRKDCGQLCFIKHSKHESSIDSYIKARKTTFRYDETGFQKNTEWSTINNAIWIKNGRKTPKILNINNGVLYDNGNELIFAVPEIWVNSQINNNSENCSILFANGSIISS